MPHGSAVDLEVITHPGAALIIPFLSRDKVVLLRQFRPVIGKYLFEAPAGTLKPGERHLACARREMIEETGYCAAKFTRLGTIVPVPGYSTEKIVIFKAEGLSECPGHTEEDECLEPVVFSRSQVRSLFKAGKLVDAKTICGLALCGWL